MGFYHGLSGLNAASKSLDVIGNNVANSNTTGFKSSRAEFNEMVASAMGAASGSSSGTGVNVAAVSQQFSQGVITPTSNGLDMAINGDGFFVVNTPGGIGYTRSGNFQLDKTGQLTTVNGDNVMGYTLDPDTGMRNSFNLSQISFPTGAPIPAKASSQITASLNLDARANLAAGDAAATPPLAATPRATYGTSLEVYDTLGVAHPASFYFEKSGTNEWAVYNSLDAGASPLGSLRFNTDGTLDSANSDLPMSWSLNPTTSGAASPLTVSADFSAVSQFGSSFSVARLSQDGYTSGELTGVNVSNDGTIRASYSNGITRAEAQLALARFSNTQGLVSDGNNNWIASSDSGAAVYGTAGAGSFGSVQGSALEESNVDLTAELVNMMTAQRAYQANAQTIKTQDQVFSTLVNLR